MRQQRRKLLIATVGVAAINYLACESKEDLFTSGNLVSPKYDATADQFISSGNLMAPPDAALDASGDAQDDAADANADADLDGAIDGGDADPDAAADAGDGAP